MKSTSFLLLLLVASSVASLLPQDVEEEWEEWKEEHVKVYGSRQEEDTARAAWRRNRDYVIAHNDRHDVTFTLALNQFADVDLTQRKLSSHRKKDNSVKFSPEVRRDFRPRAPPVGFDWRTKGVIPPVRNTSSVVGTYNDVLESVHGIRTGQLVNLSTGELTDCCIPGPDPILDVFECVHKHGGLCSEADYPNATGQCRNNSCAAVADDVKWTDFIKRGDEDSMVTVVLLCPLIVNINARNPSFVFYQSGVFDDSSCSQTDLDQTMLLVGYGEDSDGTPYWILKNDWGVKWGIEGYILMKRGENMCGVAMSVSFPQ